MYANNQAREISLISGRTLFLEFCSIVGVQTTEIHSRIQKCCPKTSEFVQVSKGSPAARISEVHETVWDPLHLQDNYGSTHGGNQALQIRSAEKLFQR